MQRRLRRLSLFVVMTLTVLSFQNCAPQKQDDSANQSASARSSQSSVLGSSSNSSGNKGNVIQIGSGSGSGGSSSGSLGTKNGGVIQIGGGGGSGGFNGNTGTGANNNGNGFATNNGPLRILSQPKNINVFEEAAFELNVDVTGGKPPYTYQWYLNGKAIEENNYAVYYTYKDTATSYKKEGYYHVVIRDDTGLTVQSTVASVGFNEPTMGCEAGSYFTYTNDQFDLAFEYFTEYFAAPRGKYLLYQSYDTYNSLYPNRSFAGLKDWIVPSLKYQEQVNLPCTSNIPRIHTPARRPSFGMTYRGAVIFECHNRKLKFVADTCKWQ